MLKRATATQRRTSTRGHVRATSGSAWRPHHRPPAPTTAPDSTQLPGIWGGAFSFKRGADHYFLLPDLQGHTRHLANAAGAVTHTFIYDAWGREIWPIVGGDLYLRPFGQWGYWRDTASRLYVRARHLRVDLGRWVSRDPLGGFGNLYASSMNAPHAWVDPAGLTCVATKPLGAWLLLQMVPWLDQRVMPRLVDSQPPGPYSVMAGWALDLLKQKYAQIEAQGLLIQWPNQLAYTGPHRYRNLGGQYPEGALTAGNWFYFVDYESTGAHCALAMAEHIVWTFQNATSPNDPPAVGDRPLGWVSVGAGTDHGRFELVGPGDCPYLGIYADAPGTGASSMYLPLKPNPVRARGFTMVLRQDIYLKDRDQGQDPTHARTVSELHLNLTLRMNAKGQWW